MTTFTAIYIDIAHFRPHLLSQARNRSTTCPQGCPRGAMGEPLLASFHTGVGATWRLAHHLDKYGTRLQCQQYWCYC